jgi:hypothetical protein
MQHEMTLGKRTPAFHLITVFFALSLVLLLAGQTVAIFAYDLTVRLGLQESIEEVTAFGVEMNRAFGAGDTFVYIPLIALALVGLVMRKRWALIMTAAVMGISVYWTATMAAVLILARSVPGYSYLPGPEIWIFIGAFMVFGIWGLTYLAYRGERLLR